MVDDVNFVEAVKEDVMYVLHVMVGVVNYVMKTGAVPNAMNVVKM